MKLLRLFTHPRPEIRMALLRVRGRRIIHFLHISKAGGTAIKAALAPHAENEKFVITFNHHDVVLRDIPAGDKVIFCLRDPVTRFVSGFLSRKRKGQPRYFTEWTPGEKEAFERFATPNALALALASESADEQAAAQRAMGAIEHVKHSYTRWFESEAYFLSRLGDVLFVAFQESLDTDFEELKRVLGLPAEAMLPKDPVQAHRNPEKASLEERAAANLREWYKWDYAFIDLCRRHFRKVGP